MAAPILAGIIEKTASAALDEAFAEFRSKDGFAKTNRWEIVITPPTGNRGGSSGNVFASIMGSNTGEGVTRRAGLMCEAFSFPGRNLTTTPDSNLYGPEREMVDGYTFGDVSSTFRLSSDMKEKQFFDTWQRLAYSPQDFSIGYYYNYVGEIRLYQLDEQDNRRYGVKLLECYPKTIDQMAVTQGAGDLQKVNVTWAYRYWLSLTDEENYPRPLTETQNNTISKNNTGFLPSTLRYLT